MNNVVALIPAFNEEAYIVQTLTAVDKVKFIDEIVVIDDGSTDNTFGLASSCNLATKLTVFRLPCNGGKGGALNHGRRKVAAEIYLMLDADLGATAELARLLLGPLLSGEVDMTVAQFAPEQSVSGAKMGFGLARRMASLGVKALTGQTVSSPLSGQRAIRNQVLDEIGEFFEGFGVEVALTVGALHYGFKVAEVPVSMKHRALGRGLRGLKHRGRQFLQVLRALWQCWKKGWHI